MRSLVVALAVTMCPSLSLASVEATIGEATAKGPSTPPPPPVVATQFRPRWAFALRLASVTPTGSLVQQVAQPTSPRVPTGQYLGTGVSLEGTFGLHFSPAQTLYAFWESGRLGHGSLNADSPGTSLTNAVGLGFELDTHRGSDVGLLLDAGLGVRWLSFPVYDAAKADGGALLFGVDLLRVALGLAIPLTESVRLDLSLRATVTVTTRHSGTCLTSETCDGSLGGGGQQGNVYTIGLRAGLRFDL